MVFFIHNEQYAAKTCILIHGQFAIFKYACKIFLQLGYSFSGFGGP